MLNIVICDDEAEQRRHLKIILKNELELKGLAVTFYEFTAGEDFLAAPQSGSADLIFFDIEMKALDGMETAKALRRRNSAAVIVFVTAYDDYVFQGYDVQSLNYILKPYRAERIKGVLNDALTVLDKQGTEVYAVETKSGVYKLPLKDVFYFMSDKRKIVAVTAGKNVEFYGKLDDLEGELPHYFARSHRRYLLNLYHVTAVEKNHARIGVEVLPVSRGQYQNLMVVFAKTLLT